MYIIAHFAYGRPLQTSRNEKRFDRPFRVPILAGRLFLNIATMTTIAAATTANAAANRRVASTPRSASTASPKPESSQDLASADWQWTVASTFKNAVLSPSGAPPEA